MCLTCIEQILLGNMSLRLAWPYLCSWFTISAYALIVMLSLRVCDSRKGETQNPSTRNLKNIYIFFLSSPSCWTLHPTDSLSGSPDFCFFFFSCYLVSINTQASGIYSSVLCYSRKAVSVCTVCMHTYSIYVCYIYY